MKYFNLKLLMFFVFGTLITSCSDDNGSEPIIDTTSSFVGDPFTTTWETTADNQALSTFVLWGFGFDTSIDWGDGTTSLNQESGLMVHTYDTAGTYVIKFYGDYPRLKVSDLDRLKLKSVDNWGDQEWDYMAGFFFNCENLVVNATDIPNTSNVLNMTRMFYNATSFNQDINGWDVSKVTNMNHMFYNATNFNQDLGNWDVGNVLYMESMFNNATNFNQDIGGWDVSNVFHMKKMFYNATNFNQDLGDWHTSNVVECANFGFNSGMSPSSFPVACN